MSYINQQEITTLETIMTVGSMLHAINKEAKKKTVEYNNVVRKIITMYDNQINNTVDETEKQRLRNQKDFALIKCSDNQNPTDPLIERTHWKFQSKNLYFNPDNPLEELSGDNRTLGFHCVSELCEPFIEYPFYNEELKVEVYGLYNNDFSQPIESENAEVLKYSHIATLKMDKENKDLVILSYTDGTKSITIDYSKGRNSARVLFPNIKSIDENASENENLVEEDVDETTTTYLGHQDNQPDQPPF